MNRVVPGLILVACWLLLLLYAPLSLFWLVILIVGTMGAYEYYRMVADDLQGVPRLLVLPLLVLPLAMAVNGHQGMVMLGLFMGLLGIVGLTLGFYRKIPHVQRFLSAAALGLLYIGFCLAHVVLLRFLPHGSGWLLVLSAVTAGSDTGAYYAGRAFGRRKLCRHISPGKTVEGAAGGIGAGVLAAVIMTLLALPSGQIGRIILAAVLLGIIGIGGDLTESVLKRSAGIKDSGTLLAGHGGVLDRGDSLLLTAPLLYYLINFGFFTI